jgi:hypothetical protein
LTANGFSVRALAVSIAARRSSGPSAAPAIDPSPPALETAAATSGVEIRAIGAWISG